MAARVSCVGAIYRPLIEQLLICKSVDHYDKLRVLDARDRQPGVPHVLEYFLEALILAWEVYSPDYHTLRNVYDYNEEIRL